MGAEGDITLRNIADSSGTANKRKRRKKGIKMFLADLGKARNGSTITSVTD